MEITLKNNELKPAIDFLLEMPLKSAESRHRMKLVNLLKDSYEGLLQAEKDLMKEYKLLDDEDNLLPEEKRDIKKVQQFNKEQAALMLEEVVMKGGIYVRNIEKMPEILGAYEGELVGDKAEIYDRLVDELEKNNEIEAND